MNLLTFYKKELKDNIIELNDYRFEHIIKILKASVGQELKVGQVNGKKNIAEVILIDKDKVRLKLKESVSQEDFRMNSQAQKQNLNVSIVMALPRPQTVKKVLELCGVFSVKNLTFINSKKVEKSYFSSSVLDNMDSHLLTGMQQGMKTMKTEVIVNNKFKNGLSQALELNPESEKIIAELYNQNKINTEQTKQGVLLAIGPEGGWLPDEIEYFHQNDFKSITLGSSVLRVEQAMCAALAQLELLS